MDELERKALALSLRMQVELLELRWEELPGGHPSKSLIRRMVDDALKFAERLESR